MWIAVVSLDVNILYIMFFLPGVLDRQYYENLTLTEKRRLYSCRTDFCTLADIESWNEYNKKRETLLKQHDSSMCYK